MNSKNLWIDEANAAIWAEACHREISNWLSVTAGEDPDQAPFANNLKISLEVPTAKVAERAIKRNCTLTGKIHFRWQDWQPTPDQKPGQKPLMVVPMPFNGVFLYRRDGSARPLVSVWPSWLAERHAFRIVLPTGEKKRKDARLEWRLGLPDGTWVGAPLLPVSKLTPAEKRNLKRKGNTYIGVPHDLPVCLVQLLPTFGPASMWESFHQEVLKCHENGELSSATDEDDLNHLRLITFPIWLRRKVAVGLLEELRPKFRGAKKPPKVIPEDWQKELDRREIQEVLLGQKPGCVDVAAKARVLMMEALVPLGEEILRTVNNYQSDERADYIDPINPLDLAARITKVQRIHLRAADLEEKPAEFRQNHPSFQGRICPVESPESGQVGLTVQLATGASLDVDGVIQQAPTPAESIGFGAGLIPFLAHNDGARDMMGAKNLRQAIPCREATAPAVESGREREIIEFVKPLTDLGICPPASDGEGRFCVGCDLLAAYTPWYGMNMEDAIVLSESAALKLGSEGLRKPPIQKELRVGWAPVKPDRPKDYPNLDDKGLVTPGTRLHYGAPLAFVAWEGMDAKGRSRKEKTTGVLRYEERTPAVVRSIEFIRQYDWMKGRIEYELELPIPIRPGDKLMGRHGNKGVVGAILPDIQMPKLPDHDGIPESFRGRPMEIILNPHGVIGRMNIGQLMETQLGWLLHTNTASVNDLLYDGADSLPGSPFSKSLDPEKMSEAMVRSGFDPFGRVRLSLMKGKETNGGVTVGFQHIVRLRHIPELKSQARQGGAEALYSARTGQAVRGRKHGGGQRVGEMEIWALSGHMAEAVLDEILGIKSSGELFVQEAGSATPDCSGYSQFFQDWLFAMGIYLFKTDDQISLSFLDDGNIKLLIPEESKVTSAASIQSRPAAVFECTKGSKHHQCGYKFLDGEQIAFSASAKKNQVSLSLRDVLRHLHFAPAGKLVPDGHGGFSLPLQNSRSGKPAQTLTLTFDANGGDFIKGVAVFDQAGANMAASAAQITSLQQAMAEGEWAKPKERTLPEIHLYGRFKNSRAGANWSPSELIDQFQRDEPTEWNKATKNRCRCVLDLLVTCSKPDDSSSQLSAVKPFSEELFTDVGGLLDPGIFGNYHQAFENTHRWGYIELPVAVEYPLYFVLTKSWKKSDQEAATSEYIEKLKKNGSTPPELPRLTRIPVLPSRYRLPSRSKGRIVRNDLETKGYIPLLEVCEKYRQIEAGQTKRDLTKARADVEDQVAWIIRHLAEAIGKKTGAIRQDGLGRRVDGSARLVITPNPKLEWDQVGVPTAVLYELLGNEVRHWRDLTMAESKLPEAPKADWHALPGNNKAFGEASILIKEYLKAHEDFVILLNRQPSLHRDSFQAFKPVPLPVEAGDVLQLNPLVCKGFAADFDGDEMVIHVPVSGEAQAEARRMLPSKNLYSLATVPDDGENVLAHFDQDFVMGTWFLGKADPFQLRETFVACLPDGEVKAMAEAWGNHPTKSDGGRLLAALAAHHQDDAYDAARVIKAWMTIALEACTRAGVSFGYLELLEVAKRIEADVLEECNKQREILASMTNKELEALAITDQGEPNYNEPLEVLTRGTLESVLNGPEGAAAPGYGFAAMAISGARGKDEQIRQILAARGILNPGKLGFNPFQNEGRGRFFISSNLMRGLDPDEFFWAAMNARSSMIDKKLGTGHAGGLTRSLVFALWSYRVTTNDCGSIEAERSPATCKVKGGVCAACYLKLPDGQLPPVGFPAGLIAAQSIGERGTQLSMQSFHGGRQAINIHKAGSAIRNAGVQFESEADFRNYLKSARAYGKLADRHFSMLWKVLTEDMAATMGKLRKVIDSGDAFNLLGYNHTPKQLMDIVMTGRRASRSEPISRLLTGKPIPPEPEEEN